MKRIIIAILIIAATIALVACDSNAAEAETPPRMVCIERTAYGDIICDQRTGVVYFAYQEKENKFSGYGGVCVMVDENGKPLVYTGGDQR